ncbi:serine/threonine-protein kinase ATG1a [Euphorbia lathyris]|uniref:serine/threonine-protein kinase ATG1a n=1 Tax=Euphorbia lathyris TaxID=212925 RepID=UPI0033136DD6
MDLHHARTVGNYILGPRIGSGSFAVVWRARDRFSPLQFAVKEIDKNLLTPKISDNLLKEISILSTIRHPNIIRLFDSIQTEDKIFLVLEYCDGGDLAAYIHRHGKVSQDVARHFMRQLAAGLQVLQEKHLIHRDLKPQNLLLSSHEATPQLKIGDFGFARSLTPQDLADTLCGSPLYMAPEIIQNLKYDAKADLWSVGAILFELVTGTLPFHGNTQYQLFQNILASTELQFPEGALEDLHPECVDLCRSLLHHNPVERLSFMEFFNHKFLEEPRLMLDGDKSSLPEDLKLVDQRLDSSASDKRSQLHSEDLICSAEEDAKFTSLSLHDIAVHGNVHGGSSGNSSSHGPMPCSAHDRMGKPVDGSQWSSDQPGVADSLESIAKDYVLVNRHFASTDNFSYYSETLLQGNSAAGVPAYPPKKNDQDMQGETTLHPSTRLHLLRQYVQAIGELALEKHNAGQYLESFSVELVVLALWKKVLRICNSWMASTAGGELCARSSAVESTHARVGMTDKVDLGEPSSARAWAEQEFIAAYDRAEKLSSHIRDMDAAAEMPDAMEIIFQKALNFGTSGAVDEYMENKDNAADLYSKALLLLSFVVEEAPSLPINPLFVLTPANKKRIESYITKLQSHQSRLY